MTKIWGKGDGLKFVTETQKEQAVLELKVAVKWDQDEAFAIVLDSA